MTVPTIAPAPPQKLQGKVYETRASLLRRYSEPVDPPPQWKMDRWTSVRIGHTTTQMEAFQCNCLQLFGLISAEPRNLGRLLGHGFKLKESFFKFSKHLLVCVSYYYVIVDSLFLADSCPPHDLSIW